MKKALIFCLGSSKDLISSAQTAQQIRDENPQVEIHLITFSHHKSKTRLLKCVGKIHYINQFKYVGNIKLCEKYNPLSYISRIKGNVIADYSKCNISF